MTDQPRQRRTTPRDADADVLRRRNHELATLKQIAETLNKGIGLHETLANTLPLVVKLLALHTGWLFLLDEEKAFHVAAHHNLPSALAYPGPPWRGECTCQKLARTGQLRGAAQVVECSRLHSAPGDRQGLAYHASVPLVEGERLLGIMNMATSHWDVFTPQDLQLVTAVGYQLATAIERAQLAEQATRAALIEERNRLAREVHDTLAQELAGIALQLEAADALLDSSPERARARIRQALERTRESLVEARRSVLDLRSGPLERRSLPDVLRELAERFTQEIGIPVTTTITLEGPRLPARHEQSLYRIAQEALTNIRRHAHATQVELSLGLEPRSRIREGTQNHANTDQESSISSRNVVDQAENVTGALEGNVVVLRIADDGQGFDTDSMPDTSTDQSGGRGFGLISMQERANLLRGTLRISSSPSAGTRVEVTLPLDVK
jgi:two-component system NarL family sensor kinase